MSANNNKGVAAKERNILLIMVGETPAVITESIWAILAKGVEVSEVQVITSTRGKEKINSQLFGVGDRWTEFQKSLRKQFADICGKGIVFHPDTSITLLQDANRQPIADLNTEENLTVCANIVLAKIRELRSTENTKIHAVISGGRKTMGALLMSCMNLVGRNGDHVVHVMIRVGDGVSYEAPVGYLFPRDKKSYYCKNKSSQKEDKISDAKIKVTLLEMPLIFMGKWYEDKTGRKIEGDIHTILSEQQTALDNDAQSSPPKLHFDFENGQIKVEGDSDPLHLDNNWNQFTLLAVDLMLRKADSFNILCDICNCKMHKNMPPWLLRFQKAGRFSKRNKSIDNVGKVRSDIKANLKKSSSRLRPYADFFQFRKDEVSRYPKECLSQCDIEKFTSILNSAGIKIT